MRLITEHFPVCFSACTTGVFSFDNTYDYCLSREGLYTRDLVYFNFDELEDILYKIDLGLIKIIDGSSILYCKDDKTYNKLPRKTFECLSTIY